MTTVLVSIELSPSGQDEVARHFLINEAKPVVVFLIRVRPRHYVLLRGGHVGSCAGLCDGAYILLTLKNAHLLRRSPRKK